MKRHLIAAGILALGIGTVLAQDDVIALRKQTMKDVGQATADPVKMLKGEEPFDLAKVQSSLKIYVAAAQKLPGLFPDTAKTGDGTHALPAIWDNKADFTSTYDKLGKDASNALASIKDEA